MPRPGFVTRWRLTRTYRAEVKDAGARVYSQLSRIGHPEYPRRETAAEVAGWLNGLLDLNRLLLAWRCLDREAADRDLRPLLELRRRALDEAEGEAL